jgi:hypothetical protein
MARILRAKIICVNLCLICGSRKCEKNKKRRSGQITAIHFPKRLFYPTFAVLAKLPFPPGNRRMTAAPPLTSNQGMS